MTSNSTEYQQNGGSLSSCGRLRVLFLASEWGSSKGGLSTINRELAISIAKEPGVDVTFFVPRCNDEDKNAALGHKIKLLKASRNPGMEELQWLSFPPDDLHIDIVVGHGMKLGPQANAIRRSQKCKWIQVVHTVPEELGMHKTYPNPTAVAETKHETEVELCQLADFVVSIGPKLNEAFRCYLSSCKMGQRVFNFTPGIFSEFIEVKQVPEREGKFQVLLFGRGDNEDFSLKGFDIAAKAVAALNNVKLVFVGAKKEELEEVKSRFLDCGIHVNNLKVRSFLQNRESLKNLLCEVDLAIMPSRTEGFGLTGLEALSAGLPILVSGNSGLGEALRKVLFGQYFVVDSDDAQAWENAIKSMSNSDRSKRLEECRALRSSYANTYSWEKQSKDLIAKMISLVQDSSTQYESVTSHRTSQQTEVPSVQHPGTVPVVIELESATFQRDHSGDLTCVMREMANRFFDTMAAGIANEEKAKCLYYYLEGVRQVKVKEATDGSLRITVECRTLEILEELWEDYCSGHLNAVAEECLLTDDIMRKLHVESVTLKTRIFEEDYLACQQFLKGLPAQYQKATERGCLEHSQDPLAKIRDNLLQDCTHVAGETLSQCVVDSEPVTLHLSVNGKGISLNMQQDNAQQTDVTFPEELVNIEANDSHIEEFPAYLQNIKLIHDSRPTEESVNTLRVAVECENLEILEQLWRDYRSGHLNVVAEKCLVTDDIKRRFHLKSVKLRTTVLQEDYQACKDFLMNNSQCNQSLAEREVISSTPLWHHGSKERMALHANEKTKIQSGQQMCTPVMDSFAQSSEAETFASQTVRDRAYLAEGKSDSHAVDATCFQSADVETSTSTNEKFIVYSTVGVRNPSVETESTERTRTRDVGDIALQFAEGSKTRVVDETWNKSAKDQSTQANEETQNQSAEGKRNGAVEETWVHPAESQTTQDVADTQSQSVEEQRILAIKETQTNLLGEKRLLLFQKFRKLKYQTVRGIYIKSQFEEETCGKSYEESYSWMPGVKETRDRSVGKSDPTVHTTGADLPLTRNSIGGISALYDMGALSEALEVNKTVTNLNLSGKSIGDVGAHSLSEALKVNNEVTNIDFSNDDIGDSRAHGLSEALKVNKTVTNVDLSWNGIGDSGACALAEALKVNKTVTNVDLSGNNIGDSGSRDLSEALKVNKTVTNVDLSGNNIGNSGARDLSEALKVNRTVTNVDLSGNNISHSGARGLSKALKVNRTVTNVDLSANDIADLGAHYLSKALKVNKTVTKVDLSGNRIGDSGAYDLSEALKVNKTVTNVDLSGNYISDFGACDLSEALKVNNTVTNVDLSGNYIGNSGACDLSEALKVNKTVTNVDLSGNAIGDSGACDLSEALKVNKTVTKVDLSGSDFSACDLSEVLKVNNTVTNVDLSGNGIGDSGACALAEALKVNKTVTNVDLSGNDIGDVGAYDLSEALKVNKTVTNVDLSSNNISDVGACDLSEALKVNNTVTTLNLSNNSVLNQGARYLTEALKANETVTNLDLSGNRIGDIGGHDPSKALKVSKAVSNLYLTNLGVEYRVAEAFMYDKHRFTGKAQDKIYFKQKGKRLHDPSSDVSHGTKHSSHFHRMITGRQEEERRLPAATRSSFLKAKTIPDRNDVRDLGNKKIELTKPSYRSVKYW